MCTHRKPMAWLIRKMASYIIHIDRIFRPENVKTHQIKVSWIRNSDPSYFRMWMHEDMQVKQPADWVFISISLDPFFI